MVLVYFPRDCNHELEYFTGNVYHTQIGIPSRSHGRSCAVWGSAMWGDRAVAAWEFIEQSKAGVLICLCGSCVPSALMKPGQSDADFSFQYNQRIGRHLDLPTGTERGVNVVPL
jgi:hypothetical protein